MKTDTEWFEIDRLCRLLAVPCRNFEPDTLCVKIIHNYLCIFLLNYLNIFKTVVQTCKGHWWSLKGKERKYKWRSKEQIQNLVLILNMKGFISYLFPFSFLKGLNMVDNWIYCSTIQSSQEKGNVTFSDFSLRFN